MERAKVSFGADKQCLGREPDHGGEVDRAVCGACKALWAQQCSLSGTVLISLQYAPFGNVSGIARECLRLKVPCYDAGDVETSPGKIADSV